MGFEKLIDLIVQFLEFFRFCTIVDCYERGVRLRFGKFHSVMEPGFHWLAPFYIDNPITESTVTQLYQCATQSLVTFDGKVVAAGIVITYNIRDIRKALLEVHAVKDAVYDACHATVAEMLAKTLWDEVRSAEFLGKLTAACRKLGFRYGIEIEQVRFSELAPVRTLRLVDGK
jgi:membrane protease subunit HflK